MGTTKVSGQRDLSRLLIGTVLAGGALTATPVFAQEDSGGLEDIIVTAQRRAQDLQSVSISVQALTADQLEQRGVRGSEELDTTLAGLQTYNYAGRGSPQFFVRGIGSADFAQNTPPASPVYIDEVYLAANVVSGFQLFDLERVEVLKGPQGTLFGRNTVGGAVSYTTRRSGETPDGYAQLSAGSFDSVGGEAAFGGPISDNFSFRVATKFNLQNEGYFENSYPGSVTSPATTSPVTGASLHNPDDEAGRSNDYALRGAIAYEPTDDVSILLTATYAKSEGDSFPLRAIGILDGGSGCSFPNPAQPGDTCVDVLGASATGDGRHFQNDFIGEQTQEGGGVTLRLELQNDNGTTFTALSAFNHGEQSLGSDVDGTANFQLNKVRYYDVESFSQEIRLASDDDSNLFWLVGAYVSQDSISLLDDTGITTEANLIGNGTLPLTNLTDPFLGPCLPDFSACPGLATGEYARASGAVVDNNQDTFSWAVFGHTEWQFTDQLKLTVGARYTSVNAEMQGATSWFFPATRVDGSAIPDSLRRVTANVDGTGPGIVDDEQTWTAVTGRVALDWTPTDNLLLYASYNRGFRQGGFEGNFVLSAVNAVPYDEETLDSYEVGWKSEIFDHTLRFNGAIYSYAYSDAQQRVTGISPVTGAPANFVQNIGDAEQWGVDVDLTWRPTQGLTLGLASSYLDQSIDAKPGVVVGEVFPFASEWSGTFNVRYEWDISEDMMAAVQTDVKYNGEYYTTAENQEALLQDAYTLVNARVSLGAPNGDWEAAIWGSNLTDEEYITQAYALFGAYVLGYNRPTTWGVSLTRRW